jgi:putative protease
MKEIELLAPAGDLDRLKWALIYGADAVYVGGYDYSLRANANNFSLSDLNKGVKFAHKLNKKVYVTVNMLFHNNDLKKLDDFLIKLHKINIDGIIISDFAVLDAIKRIKLDFYIILSTQQSLTNYSSINFFESLGINRVVLASECSKEDIVDIKNNSDMSLEVFIHGAMCTSYSGRCVLSNYVTLRDSNRGGCSQVCRFSFNTENYNEIFSMNSKDLNMIDYISEMIDLGIDSFKIEGRMKSLYYIATVVDAYRNIIDAKLKNTLTPNGIEYYKTILNRCANRDNTSQFYNKLPGVNEQNYTGRMEISNQDFLAIVKSYNKKDKTAIIEQRNYFKIGDEIEIFGPNTKVFSYKVESIINENNESVMDAKHPQEILKINVSNKVNKNDIIRVKLT